MLKIFASSVVHLVSHQIRYIQICRQMAPQTILYKLKIRCFQIDCKSLSINTNSHNYDIQSYRIGQAMGSYPSSMYSVLYWLLHIGFLIPSTEYRISYFKVVHIVFLVVKQDKIYLNMCIDIVIFAFCESLEIRLFTFFTLFSYCFLRSHFLCCFCLKQSSLIVSLSLFLFLSLNLYYG